LVGNHGLFHPVYGFSIEKDRLDSGIYVVGIQPELITEKRSDRTSHLHLHVHPFLEQGRKRGKGSSLRLQDEAMGGCRGHEGPPCVKTERP
jgi:hypothetical protein